MVKLFGELTSEDYKSLGFKCGLEVHQQLMTGKKLFCHCPSGQYSDDYDAEILRHMRPTLSELGEYDGTALMEFKTNKQIVYRINNTSACTYEFDDTPPFHINEEALDISLEIAILLKCNLVSELHIARKQYLDGSIPTGFQRTTIVGVEGELPYKGRKIRIRQLGLEEDSCREVSDKGHIRVYKTDRLGMPLIETVTYPDMFNPWEAADVAQVIRRLTRVSNKVRTGIGRARQDVNVSINGGTRVEIKGVPRILLIPLLVHTEAMRQKALLEIMNELKKREISETSYKVKILDVTSIVGKTKYEPINIAIKNNLCVKAVLLPEFTNILSYELQPGKTFENEISDRVRVIACLDTLPNIVSTESKETLLPKEWKKIFVKTGGKKSDVIVLVWGNMQDSETGAKEIEIRVREAITGVPNETRQVLKDGTTGFERILPGPDRMYPDTDLPPLAISEGRIKRIKETLPELPWGKEKQYKSMNLPFDVIIPLSLSKYSALFDKIVCELGVSPVLVATTLIQKFKHLKRIGVNVTSINEAELYKMFKAYRDGLFFKEIIPILLNSILKLNFEEAYKSLKLSPISKNSLQQEIKMVFTKYKLVLFDSTDKLRTYKFLMGKVMKKVKGGIDGKIVSREVKEFLSCL